MSSLLLGVVVIAAASDLSPAVDTLTKALAARNTAVKFVVGSSGQLANQIRQGAPYDVYLAANESFTADLDKEGFLVAGSRVRYATGHLALVFRRAGASRLEDLANSDVKRIAIANPAVAPYGAAAKQTLQAAGLWTRIETKLVYAENVRQALQFADSGNVDAAIVAASMTTSRPQAYPVSPQLHTPIIQAGGIVKGSKAAAEAKRVLDFLTSREGRKLLESLGFGPPPK